MGEVTIGIYIEDKEYRNRFCAILMNYYRTKVSIHIYSCIEELSNRKALHLDAMIVEAEEGYEAISNRYDGLIYYLSKEQSERKEEGGVMVMSKYESVAQIMDEIMRRVGQEVHEIYENGTLKNGNEMLGVYGLVENECQFPFALTLGSILAEKDRVLILNLQENSGSREYERPEDKSDLEDLLYLAKVSKLSVQSVQQAMGTYGAVDYIYPLTNSELLSEADYEVYESLLMFLQQEMNYRTIIINFGSRFQGFLDVMSRCERVYMMHRRGGLGEWREQEFEKELNRRGYQSVIDCMTKVEIPIITGNVSCCENIVEQWRWNEFGENIRKMSYMEAVSG